MRGSRLVCLLALAHLALACVGIVLLADEGTWDFVVLGALLALCVVSDFVEIEFKRMELFGTVLGLVVAMALLGPAQAAVLGLVAYATWAVRERPRLPFALSNLADHASASIAGGLTMLGLGSLLGAGPADIAFAPAVVAGFTVAWVVNVSNTLVTDRLLDGLKIWEHVRKVFVPLVPSEAVVAILAAIIVYMESTLGSVALVLLVSLVFLYLYLVRELLISQERAEELEVRAGQLASLQVGVLTAMLRTLSMRDQMTARHSAAVARYARAIAKAAGCTKEEQDLAHTAGLLHDIGKFILPDHILLADSKLNDDDWQLIRMHPYQGAKVVREVEGYGPIADIIWCHHERIDGRGYPNGIVGEDIPIGSRIISIADTYDVMTSRDSYRKPVSKQEAIDELRRVAGGQLDAHLVEVFIGLVERQVVGFRHNDAADFERELNLQRKVRAYAEPRQAVAA